MNTQCQVCEKKWPNEDYFIAEFTHSKVYLHEDQFLPGWSVLILKQHATELFQLTNQLRHELIDEVNHLAQALQQAFQAVKINYSLLGNLVPHIHWHITPRLTNDPAPLEAPFAITHEKKILTTTERFQRIELIRSDLEDKNQQLPKLVQEN